ncbi:MAG: hypothetical protein LIO60_06535 [Oscillospiraceae bacterium]|nr:hypothetical protein [Oscillospiraceae bacterium]
MPLPAKSFRTGHPRGGGTRLISVITPFDYSIILRANAKSKVLRLIFGAAAVAFVFPEGEQDKFLSQARKAAQNARYVIPSCLSKSRIKP